jgi:hypothetical protein
MTMISQKKERKKNYNNNVSLWPQDSDLALKFLQITHKLFLMISSLYKVKYCII